MRYHNPTQLLFNHVAACPFGSTYVRGFPSTYAKRFNDLAQIVYFIITYKKRRSAFYHIASSPFIFFQEYKLKPCFLISANISDDTIFLLADK